MPLAPRCSRGWNTPPNSAALLGRLGILLLQEGAEAEAIPLLQRALKADPDRAEVYYHLGQALLRRDEAVRGPPVARLFPLVAAGASKAAGPQNGRGAQSQRRGRVLQVGCGLCADWPLRGRQPSVPSGLGRSTGSSRRPQQLGQTSTSAVAPWGLAIAAYQEVLRRDPHYARAHYNLGNAYLLAGEEARAVAAFTQAVEADPEHRKAQQMLAKLRQREAQGER